VGVDTGVPPNATAEQIDLLRRRLLNVVGHELRTPITTLTGLAMQLARTDDPATRDDLIDALVRSAQRTDHLVRDLLLAAEVTTLVPVGEVEPVDVAELARELWPEPSEISGSATALVRPGSIRGALAALLDNADVHGEPPVTIVIGEADGAVVVEISSGGPALPADDIALAGEAFYRGERAVTTAPGLGLGLAVARTLARAEGGDVVVRGGTGGGMVARLELPSA
jgi:two-component system OmpR family sensor kinase